MTQNADEKWVFGYGSLMWRPGFSYADRRPARIFGYHRSLCVYSHVHRGTPDRPGLVLGLDRGGSCRGIAYRIDDQDWRQTVEYLREREQTTAVYLEIETEIAFADGGRRQALVYAIDRTHHQYAGKLPLKDMLRCVRQGVGRSGPNPAYVLNTHAHLLEMGVRDPLMAQLAACLLADCEPVA